MKKILFLILANIFAGNMLAQSIHSTNNAPLYKGYVGLAAGPAFPTGSIGNDVGIHFKLDVGYLIKNHVGIAGKFYGSYFSQYNYKFGLGGLLVGPLFSTSINNGNIDFDVSPLVGLGIGNKSRLTVSRWGATNSNNSSTNIAAGLDVTVRLNISKGIAISAGLDYLYAKPEELNLSSMAIMIGINYRFR